MSNQETLRKYRKCPFCGQESSGVMRCPVCNMRLDNAKAGTHKACPLCGTLYEGPGRVCPACTQGAA